MHLNDQDMGGVVISVIICTWNRADMLRKTLASLSGQVYAKPAEVIVVDNNSNDHTHAVVAELEAAWPLGSLIYLYEPRQGKQFALNKGIESAKGSILAFSDDDIVFPPDWLSSIDNIFLSKSVELIGGKTLVQWPHGQKPKWYDKRLGAVLGSVDRGNDSILSPGNCYAPQGANMAVRKIVFSRVGLFSEGHFRHMDQEFGSRCADSGVSISYEPSMVVHAPASPECLTKRYFRRWAYKSGIDFNSTNAIKKKDSFGLSPLWVYRQIVEDEWAICGAYIAGKGDQYFWREFRMWRNFGTVVSAALVTLRERHYAEWVKEKAQKKNDLY